MRKNTLYVTFISLIFMLNTVFGSTNLAAWSISYSNVGNIYNVNCYFSGVSDPPCPGSFYVTLYEYNKKIAEKRYYFISVILPQSGIIKCTPNSDSITGSFTISSPGKYNITCFVDSYNQISEPNENDNKISKIIYVPDLYPENLNITKTTNNYYNISSKVIGKYCLNKVFTVSILINNSQVYSKQITCNSENISDEVNYLWNPSNPGTYNITVFVDSANSVSEFNENNNKISKIITVSSNTCNSCSDCNNKLKMYNYVVLTTNISTSTKCIEIQNLKNKIFDCQGHSISGSENFGTHIENDGNYGFYIYNSSNITVENCYIKNFNDGIHVEKSQRVYITYNTITNTSDDGIEFDNSKNGYIANNNVYFASNDAIVLHYGTNDTYVKYNNINFALSSGVDIKNSFRNDLEGNTINNTHDGFNLWRGSANNTIASNKIFSRYGVVSDDGTLGPNNIFYNNIFKVSVDYTYNIKSSNIWNNSNRGNYWGYQNGTGYSDSCMDLNNDGICDFSFDPVNKIVNPSSGDNIDYLPIAGSSSVKYTVCNSCICTNITLQNRTLIYKVTNYCPMSFDINVSLYNDYVPWRKPIKSDILTIAPSQTIKLNATVPDKFVGWTDFEVRITDANTGKLISTSGDAIFNVPPKVKVDQNPLLIIITIVFVYLFILKNRRKRS